MLEDTAELRLPRGIKDMMLRKLLMVCVLILGMSSISYAQLLCTPESPSPPPTTPNFGLYLPGDGQCGWGLRWNQNAQTLDTNVPNRTGTNTWPALQTLSGGISLGAGSAGIPHGMKDYACIFINGIDAAIHDDLQLLIAPYAVELTDIACACMGGGCTTNPSFGLVDESGHGIPHSALTCSSTLASNWVAIDSNDIDHLLAEGEGVRLNTNSATTGDKVIVCVRYIVT